MDGPTVLLTGATGLLGTCLRRCTPERFAVCSLTHRRRLAGDAGLVADLRDRGAVVEVFERLRPDVVVHAAYAHDEVSIVDATQHIVDAAGAVGADVVYVSTDAVFSGDGTPRAEQSVPDPIWDYGRWKARAEQIVAAGSPSSAVVRLPLVVSLEPEDHVVAQIRAGAADGKPTVWFDDELRQPAPARELARALWDVVALDAASRAGSWHLPGPERLTRYEIAQRVVAALGLTEDAIASAPTPTQRPRDIHLLDDRARSAIGWNPTPILAR